MDTGAVLWRQPGCYDVQEASQASALQVHLMPSETIQSFGAEADISNIVKRYYATGEFPVRRELGEYGDFDDAMDLRQMLDEVRRGEQTFLKVPADVRARFDNDAGTFLEWIHNPEHHDEAADLGLLPKRPRDLAAPSVRVDGGVVAAGGDPSVSDLVP